MTTLYEIDEQIQIISQSIEEYAEEHEGEIPGDLDQKFEALQMDRNTKIGNIARFLKNIDSDVEAVSSEIKKLTAKKKSLENKYESVKKFLAYAVGENNKFKDAVTSIYWKKSESIEVSEPEKLPAEFQNITITAKKIDLKKAIEAGQSFDGVNVITKNSIVVR